MKTLPHICFAGCGSIARRHSKILRSLFKSIPISFASRSGGNAEEYRAEFRGVKSFESYAEAFADENIDIIFITTPHAFHSEIAVKAAKAGKDIIIEKPITRNSTELKKIIRAVETSGVRCTVAENYLYKPIVSHIDRFINEGLIGKVLQININKYNRDTVQGWRTDPEMMGGGALLEGGVHWVNFLVSVAGYNPREVIAFCPEIEYNKVAPFEDTIDIQVLFENGCWGHLFHSWRIPNRFKGMALSKIYGTEGVITFESNGLFCSVYGKKKKFTVSNPFDFLGFKAMHRTFIEDYMAGRDWEPGLERISMELSLVEAAYRSLKSGRLEKIK